MNGMRKMARPFGYLYGLALVVALLGRIGLGIAAATGVLAFDYISASGVAILDVVCSILTGSAFVAFLFAAGLALVVSTAGPVLYGALYARGDAPAKASTAFLWGWATALVALVCLVILALGILSPVQMGSMSSKLPALPVIVVGAVAFAAFLGTLLGAASLVVCACIARARCKGGLGVRLLIACAGCGAVVMVLTLGTFSALNGVSVNTAALGGWAVADVVANLVMLFGARALTVRAVGESGKAHGMRTPAASV